MSVDQAHAARDGRHLPALRCRFCLWRGRPATLRLCWRRLSPALRQQLAQRFEGCLCRACLQALVNGAPLEPAAAAP
jgi:hypothetical protein